MLTFRLDKGILTCDTDKTTVAVFPSAPVAGSLSLLTTPQEETGSSVVSWPGEYDIGGITVRGIGQEEGRQVSYVMEVDGVRCAFPSLPLRDWSEEDIERLGEVHVLALPGGEAKKAQRLLDEVDPRVLLVLPDPNGRHDEELLKLCGGTGKEQVAEHKLKGSLPSEGREVVVFAG